MLRIKEDKMNELERFGFKKYEYTHLLVLRKDNHEFACIDIRDRRYEILDLCSLTYNLTYDLTKADLLERI